MFSKNNKLIMFQKSESNYEAICDNDLCLTSVVTFKNSVLGVTIRRSHMIGQDSRQIQQDTVITVEDEKEKKWASFCENTCHESTKMFLSSAGKEVGGKLLKKATTEEKCRQVHQLFGNNLVADLFCNSAKGNKIDDILIDQGHNIVTVKK